jgi:hypothetical protein
MLSYADLCRHPAAFPSLTGMTRPEFDTLADQFERASQQNRDRSATTRRCGTPRCNAPGAGRPHDHAPRDRLLMALVWLRAYPTYEVLGFFFDLHKRNAQLNVRAVLEVLDTLHEFPFDRPTRDRTKLRSAAAVMAAFPQVRVVIDGKEQRTNRPTGYDAQRPYYSGKKKAHTLKNQVVVDPCGRIETVSPSVPGGANHDLTVLRGSGVLERLVEGEGAMVDKGYVGVKKDYPEVPIVIPFEASRNHPLSADQEAFNREVARYRIVVEHTMAQLNRFTVLRQVFRGQKRDRHTRVIRVVAKLVNRRLAVRPLKTYAA